MRDGGSDVVERQMKKKIDRAVLTCLAMARGEEGQSQKLELWRQWVLMGNIL